MAEEKKKEKIGGGVVFLFQVDNMYTGRWTGELRGRMGGRRQSNREKERNKTRRERKRGGGAEGVLQVLW